MRFRGIFQSSRGAMQIGTAKDAKHAKKNPRRAKPVEF